MPLLRRQAFVKDNPPPGLKDEDDVFVCKTTGEVFIDYDKFFERTILCNSLVWTCELTGKSGLTFQEALDSEEKASESVASISDSLQKPILYLMTLTHRSRLNDVNDDIYNYAKEHYFIGEVVEVLQHGDKKKCKIIKVMSPTSFNKNGVETVTVASSDDDSVICLDDPPPKPSPKKSDDNVASSPQISPKKSPVTSAVEPSAGKPGKLFSIFQPKQETDLIKECIEVATVPDAGEFEYVVQEVKKTNIYIIKAEAVSRKWGTYTREKNKMFLKQACAPSGQGVWSVKEKFCKKFRIADLAFKDIFDGVPPVFKITQVKPKKKLASSASSSVIDLTDEDRAIKEAKRVSKERKKREKSERKNERRKQMRLEKKMAKAADKADAKADKAEAKADKAAVKAANKAAQAAAIEEEPNFDNLRKLSAEEKQVLREQIKADKMAARLVQLEEMKKKREEERLKKKEDRDKERVKMREDKKVRDAYMKEWNKPRDDLQCDDLQDLPVPIPIQSHVPTEMFGDVVMVLEYCKSLGSILDIDTNFPNGISISEMGKALMGTDTSSLFFDLVKLMLSTLFQLQAEEEEEDEDEEHGMKDLPYIQEDDKSFKDLVKHATIAAQWPQLNYSTALKELPIDSFTLTEVLRLHFLASGAKCSDLNKNFRFQQRGAYTSLDDAGLEFRRQEGTILKQLAEMSVFDVGPAEKLKILTALIHQILTFAASRDIIDDNFDLYRQAWTDLRQHRLTEIRREKEESAFWYKKKLEERASKKEAELARKEEQKRARLVKLAQEEGGETPMVTEQTGEPTVEKEKSVSPSESPVEHSGERQSSRQKDKVNAVKDAEFYNTPMEEIAWDKLTPDDRIRMKDKFFETELELLDQVNEILHGLSLTPVGRDRTFRRYWVFRSVPGLFVEDDDEEVPADVLVPITQLPKDEIKKKGQCPAEEKSTSSDKENDSFDMNKSSLTPVRAVDSDKNIQLLSVNNVPDDDVIVLDDKELLDTINIHDQIVQRNEVKWAYYSAEQIDPLIISLNARGYREGPLKAALLDQKNYLKKQVESTPVEEINIPDMDKLNKKVKYQNIKSQKRNRVGAVENSSAQEFLELNLREMLLDIEERIYHGTLGAIKVKNRSKWREAIEEGAYSQQCDEEITWPGQSEPIPRSASGTKLIENGSMHGEDEDDDDISPALLDLAKALLQIERSIEHRYLTNPLGVAENNKKGKPKEKAKDDENDSKDGNNPPQKCALDRWEESLMRTTSFSQVFLHLVILESSILWSKSSLHARCRICRRKGDGEKMLLCDGCDRGHHMYCLKPVVKNVPRGDWFCPDCKPKDIPKTPRKRRKSIFEDQVETVEVDSSDDDSSSSDDDDDSDDDSDDSDDSSDDSDEETEEETEEEEKPTLVTKIKFLGGPKKRSQAEAKAKQSNASRSRKSQEGSRPNSRPPSQERVKSSKTDVKRKLELEKGTKAKKAAEESRKSRRSLPEVSKPKSVPRRSLESSKVVAKRKREEDEEDEELPDAKKATMSKSRGGEKSDVMKTCETLMIEIAERKEAWPFLTPVSKRDAPDYFDIVKKGMDLATIRNKVKRYEYLRPIDLLDDIRLVFKNCQQYNMPTAPEFVAGQRMSKFFEKRVKDLKLDTLIQKVTTPKKGSSPRSSPGSSKSRRTTRK